MTSSETDPFTATRKSHLLETAEDYTELIADLIRQNGKARVCDIAKHFNVSHVTAIRSIQRLQRDGYVHTEPHQPVFLTEKGKNLAAKTKKKHQILLEFLIKIGVPETSAQIDVEGIEHHVSDKTLSAIQKLLAKLS